MSPLYVFSMIMFFSLIPFGLFGFAVQFISLRIRDLKEEHHDSQLGRKSMLYLLFNASVILFLIGMTLTADNYVGYIIGMFNNANGGLRMSLLVTNPFRQSGIWPGLPIQKEFYDEQQRMAMGMMACGCIYAMLIYATIYYFTNHKRFPAVGRAFACSRLIIAGVILLIVSTMGIMQLFQKTIFDANVWRSFVAYSIVWWPVVIIHARIIFRSKGWYNEPKSSPDPAPSIKPPTTAPVPTVPSQS